MTRNRQCHGQNAKYWTRLATLFDGQRIPGAGHTFKQKVFCLCDSIPIRKEGNPSHHGCRYLTGARTDDLPGLCSDTYTSNTACKSFDAHECLGKFVKLLDIFLLFSDYLCYYIPWPLDFDDRRTFFDSSLPKQNGTQNQLLFMIPVEELQVAHVGE